MPAHDRLAFLPAAIESVLAQTIDDWELVLVDDGSTVDLRSHLKPYLSDPRVSLHRQKQAGRCIARNNGAALSGGKYLSFLDSDDRLVPDGLAQLLGAFDGDGDIGAAVGGYDFIDEQGAVIGTRRPWEEGGELDLEGWLVKGFATPGSTMIRREWFERTRGFDPAYDGGEDRDLFVQLVRTGCQMTWVRRSVCEYRKHGGNTDARVQHRAKITALERAFRDTALPPEIVAREREAYAGVHAYIARRAAASGDDVFVRELLGELAALRVEPSWRREGMLFSPQGLPAQIQYIVGDIVDRCEREGIDVDVEFEQKARAWGVSVRDLRRARAHREVRAFFRSLEGGALDDANRHRRTALRLDPRWRAYRTLLLFPLRRAAARGPATRDELSA
jgi:GT2 family glycosyltransferase